MAQKSIPNLLDFEPTPPEQSVLDLRQFAPAAAPGTGLTTRERIRQALSPAQQQRYRGIFAPEYGEPGYQPPFDPSQLRLAETAPTALQAGMEMAGGIAGSAIGRAMGGPLGAAAGAGIGTGVTGYAAGRSLKDAAWDAAESALGELVIGAGVNRFRQWMIPSLAPEQAATLRRTPGRGGSAADTVMRGKELARGTLEPTALQTGERVQDFLGNFRGAMSQEVKKRYDVVRQRAGAVDMASVDDLARANGLQIPRRGADVVRGELTTVTEPGRRGLGFGETPTSGPRAIDIPAQTETEPLAAVSFDDAYRIRHQLGDKATAAAAKGDYVTSRAYWDVHEEMSRSMRESARQSGVLGEYNKADAFYRTEFAPRFRTETYQRVMHMSGEQIVPKLLNATSDEINDFLTSMRRLDKTHPGVMDEFRGGVVAKILSESVDPQSGLILPNRLQNILKHLTDRTPEIPYKLLGRETTQALQQFAENLGTSISRTGTTLTVGGQAGLAASGMLGGPGGSMFGPIETANELNWMARTLIRTPRIAKAMTGAVLRGSDDALRRLGVPNAIRLGATQGAVQTGIQLGPNLRGPISEGMIDLLPEAQGPTEFSVGGIRG